MTTPAIYSVENALKLQASRFYVLCFPHLPLGTLIEASMIVVHCPVT